MGFTAQHVSQLTGLSLRQVRYWNNQGFFVPQYVHLGRRTFSSVYSFRDVVGLRTLAVLRNVYKIRLQELKRIGEWLMHRYEAPWASLTFYVRGKEVFFDDPETETRIAARDFKQTAIHFEMDKIASEMAKAAERLKSRHEEQYGKITRNRYVVHNAPVIAGTRIPTSAIWNFYQAGYDDEAIIEEYPRLTPPDIRAAIEYEEIKRKKRVG